MTRAVYFLLIILGLVTNVASAADYKSLIPLLPEKLGDLSRAGKPEGMNIEMGEQAWSSLTQAYAAKNGQPSATLTVILGQGAPQAAMFQSMTRMKIETDEQLIKSVEVPPYAGLLHIEKAEKRGTLTLSLSKNVLVILEAEAMGDENDFLELAKALPLAALAAKAR